LFRIVFASHPSRAASRSTVRYSSVSDFITVQRFVFADQLKLFLGGSLNYFGTGLAAIIF
jgi:hypothetical protein